METYRISKTIEPGNSKYGEGDFRGSQEVLKDNIKSFKEAKALYHEFISVTNDGGIISLEVVQKKAG